MDALALLCNLHANGAETLRSLRARGCDSLAELCSWTLTELGSALGTAEPRQAERLIDHAKELELRLTGRELVAEGRSMPPLEPEASAAAALPAFVPEPAAALPSEPERPRRPSVTLVPYPPERPSDESSWDRSGAAPGDAPIDRLESDASDPGRPAGAKPVGRESAVGAVLQSWEALGDEPALASAVGAEAELAAPAGEAAPAAEPVPDPIEAVAGIEAALLAKLRGAGVVTVTALAEHDAVKLGRAIGLPFARVRRLQFLAQRRLAAHAP